MHGNMKMRLEVTNYIRFGSNRTKGVAIMAQTHDGTIPFSCLDYQSVVWRRGGSPKGLGIHSPASTESVRRHGSYLVETKANRACMI